MQTELAGGGIIQFKYAGELGSLIFLIISAYYLYFTDVNKTGLISYFKKKFLRLYPAYIICITITFVVTHIVPLPGRTVDIKTYILNALCLNGFVYVGYVDSAHWYLTVLIAAIFWSGLCSKYLKNNAIYGIALLTTVNLVLRWLHIGKFNSFLCGSYIGVVLLGYSLAKINEGSITKIRSKIGICLSIGIAALHIYSVSTRMLIISCIAYIVVLLATRKDFSFGARLECLIKNLAKYSYPVYLLHQNIAYICLYYMFIN